MDSHVCEDSDVFSETASEYCFESGTDAQSNADIQVRSKMQFRGAGGSIIT